jgi:plastocyanin
MRTAKHRWLLAIFAAAALVAAQACGSSYSPTTPGGVGQADVTITIVANSGNTSFSPNPGTVPVGKTVAWRNADSATHQLMADNGSFTTGTIAPGAVSSPIAMSAAGSIPYHCTIHPTMVGTLSVQ